MSAPTIGAAARYRIATIPDELKAMPRWCGFQITSQPSGKTKKLPLISGVPGKHPASCNDARTLRSFAVALRDAEARGLYLAFAFDRTLPYFFIDADDAIGPAGETRPDVALVRDTLDTYTEVSVSGTGLHIIGRGAFPERAANRPTPEGGKPLERYPLHGGRFCVFTGDVLPGFETLAERSDALAALFPVREAAHANGSTQRAGYQGPVGELTAADANAIVAWAAPFWADGRRHHMALHLSGYLGKQGVPREQAIRIIEKCAGADADPGAKTHAAHATYDNLEAGETVSGWYGLRDVCGLTEDDLAALSGVLHGFWQRSRPPSGGVRTRPLRYLPPAGGRRPTVALPDKGARHAR